MVRLTQVAVLLVISLVAAACTKIQAANEVTIVEGTVVSAQSGTLIVKDEDSVDHTHAVDSTAQVMVEGEMAELDDVVSGMHADVTLDAGKVIAVNATKPHRQDISR